MALVVIAAAVFCLTCILWMLMSGKFRPATAPPHVSEGPPIVGNLMGFALGPRGPLDFIKRNFEVHGGAYSMRVAHKTLTFLVGPKASAPFFQNRDDVFSQPEVYGFMTQVFGKGEQEVLERQVRVVSRDGLARCVHQDLLQGGREHYSSSTLARSGKSLCCARS